MKGLFVMPLQNRVDPFGDIHATAARGLFTGNRGVIHDPATKTLLKRRWTTKAWIICDCAYRGRRREVMGRNAPSGGAGWTELFFLDEVTALAAGHRPCFLCRREAAKGYASAFGAAFGVVKPTVQTMDARLHAERWASTSAQRIAEMTERLVLPDGAMVADGAHAHALRKGRALRWSFEGYGDDVDLSSLDHGKLRVLTPATTVAVLSAGYAPVWHASAR